MTEPFRGCCFYHRILIPSAVTNQPVQLWNFPNWCFWRMLLLLSQLVWNVLLASNWEWACFYKKLLIRLIRWTSKYNVTQQQSKSEGFCNHKNKACTHTRDKKKSVCLCDALGISSNIQNLSAVSLTGKICSTEHGRYNSKRAEKRVMVWTVSRLGLGESNRNRKNEWC